MGEPIILLLTVAAVGMPLLLLPDPGGIALAAAIAASSVLANRKLEESVASLPIRVGPESLLGLTALVVDDLQPRGAVRCAGELWRAVEVGGRQVPSGSRVKVITLRGLTLFVQGREEEAGG